MHSPKLEALASSGLNEGWCGMAWADSLHALIAVSELDGLIYSRRGS